MDKLNAANILGISPDATERELKRAYAQLLKQFHPEEYPEEFRRIHEAYESFRQGGNAVLGEISFPTYPQSRSLEDVSNVKEYHNEREDSNIVFDQRKGMIQAEQEDEQEDAGQAEMFLKAEEKALAMEQTRREMLIQMQLQNLQHIITTNSLKYNEKSYEAFFKTDETKAVMEEPVFISGVCNLLEGGELNTRVYRVFINYYHLRNEIWENMENEKANLYTIISDYVNIDGRVRLKQGVT